MDTEHSTWYSTYSLVTIERILDLMGIHLSEEALYQVSHTPNSPYYQLLQVPLKNVFNGILINQATDYREYGQKMLVDYLISGAANVPEDQQGQMQGAKLVLEDRRVALIEAGDQFDLLQFEHQSLINESQQVLIKKAKTLPRPAVLIDDAESSAVMQLMQPFMAQVEEITQKIKGYRNLFQQNILQVRQLLQAIPDYFSSFEASLEHREALLFDATLGDEE